MLLLIVKLEVLNFKFLSCITDSDFTPKVTEIAGGGGEIRKL